MRRTDPGPVSLPDMHVHNQLPQSITSGSAGVDFARDTGRVAVRLAHLLDDAGDDCVSELLVFERHAKEVEVS